MFTHLLGMGKQWVNIWVNNCVRYVAICGLLFSQKIHADCSKPRCTKGNAGFSPFPIHRLCSPLGVTCMEMESFYLSWFPNVCLLYMGKHWRCFITYDYIFPWVQQPRKCAATPYPFLPIPRLESSWRPTALSERQWFRPLPLFYLSRQILLRPLPQ